MDTAVIESILRKTMGLNVSSIGQTSLANAIQKRLSSLHLHSVDDYTSFVRSSPKELNNLIEEVSVTETWFFRDDKPFEAMVNFSKELFRKRRPSKLRILSLPCATGEEPYSIAIALVEAGFSPSSFSINAVDINRHALNKAKEAVYGNNSFRNNAKKYIKNRYFTGGSRNYHLHKKIKDTVTFHHGNLLRLSPQTRRAAYHIIFCRNLLIYLNEEALKTALKNLDHLLAPKGILFVGHAEPGIFSDSQFCPSSYPKTFSLVRRSENPAVKRPAPKIEQEALPQPPLKKQVDPLSQPRPADIDDHLAIDKILAARLSIHKNRNHEAITLCEADIMENGPSTHSLFWLARALYNIGAIEQAIDMLRRAVYLDPDHIEAMNFLGELLTEKGDAKGAANIKKRILRVKERLAR